MVFLPCVAVCCIVLRCIYFFIAQLSVCYRVLQCVAVCCSVLRCAAVWNMYLSSHNSLFSLALQCGAVCCSFLQCFAVCCAKFTFHHATLCVLQCVAVCCSVLQCVAVCCSFLQCVAQYLPFIAQLSVCCSVLQCVAVCCSVLQCVAVCCAIFTFHRAILSSTACSAADSQNFASKCVYICYMLHIYIYLIYVYIHMIYVLHGKFSSGLTFENFSHNKKISWIQFFSSTIGAHIIYTIQIKNKKKITCLKSCSDQTFSSSLPVLLVRI